MSATYNLVGAHQAEKYVFRRYSHLPNTALHIYAGLTFLEEDKDGFCSRMIATYREIAKASHVSKNAVKGGLTCLIEAGLVRGEIGSPVKDDKRATVLTRVSVDDLRLNSPDKDGIAQKLANALKERSFMFKGQTVTPVWSVGITGRVCSAKPNIQGADEKTRVEGLREGLLTGQTLEHADIKSAEPTVIKHLLKMSNEVDLYACYMRATGCDRPSAKKKVNMLAYCKNARKVFTHWPEAARSDPTLSGYVQKLHGYKTNLSCESQKTRSVKTLTGRLITAEKGRRLHAGKVFNWKIQGTVADIVNAAALELIGMPEVKTVVPVHDALYVIRTDGLEGTIEATLRAQAQKAGINIQITTKAYTSAG